MQNELKSAFGSSDCQEPAEPNSVVMSSMNNETENQQAMGWVHPCSYCSRIFSTPQALGGHQNAHRTERQEEKWEIRRANRNQFSSHSRTEHLVNLHGGDHVFGHSTTCMFRPRFQYEPPTGFKYLDNFQPGYGPIPSMQVRGLMPQQSLVGGQIPIPGNPCYYPYPQPHVLNLLREKDSKLLVEEDERSIGIGQERGTFRADENADEVNSGSVDLTLKL